MLEFADVVQTCNENYSDWLGTAKLIFKNGPSARVRTTDSIKLKRAVRRATRMMGGTRKLKRKNRTRKN